MAGHLDCRGVIWSMSDAFFRRAQGWQQVGCCTTFYYGSLVCQGLKCGSVVVGGQCPKHMFAWLWGWMQAESTTDLFQDDEFFAASFCAYRENFVLNGCVVFLKGRGSLSPVEDVATLQVNDDVIWEFYFGLVDSSWLQIASWDIKWFYHFGEVLIWTIDSWVCTAQVPEQVRTEWESKGLELIATVSISVSDLCAAA